ncbi:ribonuclease T [Photobacterium damselae subsp. damselae]|uniref:ribonuclease T2 family protein n=1 Tax=Photobacterium damselae TaxID=38293 RepID=UPI001F26548E|nr:ribonuclease T [Photobacterium damselae]UKA27411.1 ribonuclease T [Photobacterium damselae subsp. damselae]
MKKTIIVLCLTFANITYAEDSFEVSVNNAPSGLYNTNVVAMTWMPTFCNIRQLKNDENCVNDFKLHGIWPYYHATIDNDNILNYHPSNCYHSEGCTSTKDCDISKETISFLDNDISMQRSYPKNVTLWSHEWKKHGTCSGLNQKDYFELANVYLPKISNHYEKIKMLAQRNKNNSVDVNEIYNLLPHNTSLRCYNIQGDNYLFEVNFFFDRLGKEYNKVKTQIGDRCDGMVFLSWLD